MGGSTQRATEGVMRNTHGSPEKDTEPARVHPPAHLPPASRHTSRLEFAVVRGMRGQLRTHRWWGGKAHGRRTGHAHLLTPVSRLRDGSVTLPSLGHFPSDLPSRTAADGRP